MMDKEYERAVLPKYDTRKPKKKKKGKGNEGKKKNRHRTS